MTACRFKRAARKIQAELHGRFNTSHVNTAFSQKRCCFICKRGFNAQNDVRNITGCLARRFRKHKAPACLAAEITAGNLGNQRIKHMVARVLIHGRRKPTGCRKIDIGANQINQTERTQPISRSHH